MEYIYKDQYEKIFELINKSKTIAIISHKNPDGDTTGSGLGLYFALKTFNKDVDIYCQDVPKGRLRYIDGIESYRQDLIENKKYDLAIAVDSASIERLGEFQKLFQKAKKSIQIDHHISNNNYAKNVNIVEESGANCENIAFFLLYLKEVKKIDLFNQKTIDALYTGLVTDTGSFCFSSVTDKTMYIAYKLKELGANSHKITYNQMNTITYNVYQLKQIVMQKAKFYNDKKIVISIITKEDFKNTSTELSDTDGLIQNILNINDVECAVMLSEAAINSYKVSVRTKTIDAVDIVVKLSNGGGHPRAAGCLVNGIIEEIIDKLLNIIKEQL